MICCRLSCIQSEETTSCQFHHYKTSHYRITFCIQNNILAHLHLPGFVSAVMNVKGSSLWIWRAMLMEHCVMAIITEECLMITVHTGRKNREAQQPRLIEKMGCKYVYCRAFCDWALQRPWTKFSLPLEVCWTLPPRETDRTQRNLLFATLQ